MEKRVFHQTGSKYFFRTLWYRNVAKLESPVVVTEDLGKFNEHFVNSVPNADVIENNPVR